VVVHGVSGAELAGQVPQRDAGAGDVQDRLEEHAVGQYGRLAALVSLGLID
jgi:hypothetical protein